MPWPLMGMDGQNVYSRNVVLIISPNHFWQKTAKWLDLWDNKFMKVKIKVALKGWLQSQGW